MTKSLRPLVALIAVLVALLTTGCGVHNPTTVASFGDQRVTETQVDETSKALSEAFGAAASPDEVRSQAMQGLVIAMILPELQRRTGVTIEDSQVTEALRTARDQSPAEGRKIFEDKRLESYLKTSVAWQILNTKANQDKLSTAWNDIHVDLNPRYGTWPVREDAVPGSTSLSKLWTPTDAVATAEK